MRQFTGLLIMLVIEVAVIMVVGVVIPMQWEQDKADMQDQAEAMRLCVDPRISTTMTHEVIYLNDTNN